MTVIVCHSLSCSNDIYTYRTIMAEENVELLKATLKGDAPSAVNEITHNSNTDVFVRRKRINSNFASDHINGLCKTAIIRDAWEEDTVVQSDCQGTKLDSDSIKECLESESDRKLSLKIKLWRITHIFLSATSFHGLPMIANSKSVFCALAFWMIPILLALGLMLLALISVTNQYLEMNTVLSSKLQFNRQLPFPAITICNKNYFRRSVAETTGVDLNEIVEFLHVVSGNPFIVQNINYTNFYNEHQDLFEGEESVFHLQIAGHQIEQMLFSCTFAGEDCLHSFTQRLSYYGNCYTFNSGINTSILYSNNSGQYYGLELVLNAEEYEYFLAESVSVGFNVFIHDHRHFPYYSNADSFSITTGQETQVALRRVDYSLLTSKEGGQCGSVDLKYFDSYSHTSCVVECLTDFVVGMCECKLEYLPGPAKICNLTYACQYDAQGKFNEVVHCDCPITCDFTLYERLLSYSKYPASHVAALVRDSDAFLSLSNYDFPRFVINTTDYGNGTVVEHLNENFNKSFLTDNGLVLSVYYDTLTTTSMEEGLEYSIFQFIADFGGHIGLFIGAGFLTIFEIIQLCFGLIRPAYGLSYI